MIEVCEKKIIFLLPPKLFLLASPVLRFLECYRDLHRISSTNFKFHQKICIRSGVMEFSIFFNIPKNRTNIQNVITPERMHIF